MRNAEAIGWILACLAIPAVGLAWLVFEHYIWPPEKASLGDNSPTTPDTDSDFS